MKTEVPERAEIDAEQASLERLITVNEEEPQLALNSWPERRRDSHHQMLLYLPHQRR